MSDSMNVTAEATERLLADIDETVEAVDRATARARTAAAVDRVLASACPALDATPQRQAVAVTAPRPLPQPRPRWRAGDIATAAAIAVYTTWAERNSWRRRRRRG